MALQQLGTAGEETLAVIIGQGDVERWQSISNYLVHSIGKRAAAMMATDAVLHNENFLVRTRALAALQELTRTLGPAVAFGDLTHVWYYLLATFLGAIASAFLYKFALGVESDAPVELAGTDRGTEQKRFA